DRTREGMRRALGRGQWTFQSPLGYVRGDPGTASLVPDPERHALVRKAFAECANGRWTISELLRTLTAQGLRTRRGTNLSAKALGTLLRNPIYAGRLEVATLGVSALGDFEPLVDQETFDRAQARMNRRGTHAPSRHRLDHPDFPLRRFVR